MNPKPSVAIVGSGSFATAIAKILQTNGHQIHWLMRHKKDIDFFKTNKHNPSYLSDVTFNTDYIHFSTNISEIVDLGDIIFLLTPAAYLSATLSGLNQIAPDKMLVSGIKGIVPENEQLISAYLQQTHRIAKRQLTILSGPCHAEEVALERLSYLTIANSDAVKAEEIASLLRCKFIHVHTTNDTVGTEIATVLKNVYAIAAGITHGLRLGDNFLSVLISNAMREMNLFINALAPQDREVADSAYLGDLLVTSYSQFSRNRTFGVMLGRGYSVKAAKMEMVMTVEGYNATACIKKMTSVDMPILSTVHDILFDGHVASTAFSKLQNYLR